MTDITLEQRARQVIADWHREKGCSQQVIEDCLSGNITIPEFYMELLEAALRLSAGADWQPIETAPKDGTRVLLCSLGGAVWMGHWESKARINGWTRYNCIDIGWEPGFWQPLPAAPRHETGESDV